MPRTAKIVRDPVHEYITIYEDELGLIDSAIFQRLRHVRQNATAYLTYPAGSGSRFEHSLGVKHLAERMLASALQKSDPAVVKEFIAKAAEELGRDPEDRQSVMEAVNQLVRFSALAHDVGHPPFSHTLEEVMEGAVDRVLDAEGVEGWWDYKNTIPGAKLHEHVGTLLLRRADEPKATLGGAFDRLIQTLRTPGGDPSVLGTLHEIVAFDIDADRGDYLIRDGQTSGADFGNIDVERLIESMRLHRVRYQAPEEGTRFVIRPTIKALSAIEALLVERYKSYRWLYYHPRVVATNAVLRELCVRLFRANIESIEPFNQVAFDLRPGSPVVDRDDALPAPLFDDVYVLSAIREAHRLSEQRLAGDAGGEGSRDIGEMRALTGEVLFREKHGVILWKDVKSYEAFDKRVRPKLERIYYEDQRIRYKERHGVALPEDELTRIDRDTDFALNWLARFCLASFDDRQRLQDLINGRLRDTGAFVLISASFFKALEYGLEAGEYTLIGADGDLYRVTDISELLRHLQQARRRDILLHVYAIWPDEIPNRWESSKREEELERVSEALENALAEWLKYFLEAK